MATWKITVDGKGVKRTSIEKLMRSLRDNLGESISVRIEKVNLPESRADRFAEAQRSVMEGRAAMEELRDELQDWYDNLPDAFRDGNKGDQLQQAIDDLGQAIQHCEDSECVSVDFPGMY